MSPDVLVGSTMYAVLIILGLILTVALILAPLKLYGIYRELRWQSEEMRTQTRLLAEIANSAAVTPGESPAPGPPASLAK